MYESIFNLRQRPFRAAPDIYNYFPAGATEHARNSLIQCIERGQGPALLIGPAGTGKSLVCQLIADHFRSALTVALLAHSGVCTRRALFQSILFALRQRHRGSSEGELRLTMLNFLESSTECPNGVLLIVDEAHTLPIRLLEELRILTNLARDGQSRLRLLLAGGPALEERFADPKLESFNQRVASRCYLQALHRDEAIQYVRSQIASADGIPESVFDDGALRAIFRATDGVPRLINQLCDATLVAAARTGRRPIDAALIDEVWADLQQLPAPWQTPPEAPSGAVGIIEFGQLGEEPATDTKESASIAADSQPLMAAEPASVAEPTMRAAEPNEAATDESPAETIAAPLIPAVAPDPFGDGFDEEEVIIDRYASLESSAPRLKLKVSCDEGREITEALRQFETPPDVSLVVESIIAPIQSDLATWNTLDCVLVDASGVGQESPAPATPPTNQRPEHWRVDEAAETTESPESEDSANSNAGSVHQPPHVRVVPADDRDLLIVEEDGSTHRPRERETEIGRARRQEYRQLFAQLRRRP